LYKLLAQGRISPRQASVLAYIGSLVLRSLKDVDYDLDRFDEEEDIPQIRTAHVVKGRPARPPLIPWPPILSGLARNLFPPRPRRSPRKSSTASPTDPAASFALSPSRAPQ
jgi:hypothetical protein